MASEARILGAMLKDRAVYDVLSGLIDKSDFSDLSWIILEEVRKYYGADKSARGVDRNVLITLLSAAHPRHAEVLQDTVTRLPDESAPNVLREWVIFRRNSLGERIAAKALAGEHDPALASEYAKVLDIDPDNPTDEQEGSVMVGVPVEELVQFYQKDNLVPLYPEQLNEKIGGGLPPESHVVVYALPETGKTAFVITQAANNLRMGRKVLYIGNEDPGPVMLTRIISRLTGMNRAAIEADPARADRLARERGYDNLVFCGQTGLTLGQVDALVEEHKPELVVIDQLHNLRLRSSSSKVEGLEQLASGARDISKRRKTAVISVTQAADSASGKSILDMGDVYFSNVAVQQAADVMIGLGMSRDNETSGQRGISLCKNKLTGDHSPMLVRIQPELSRVY